MRLARLLSIGMAATLLPGLFGCGGGSGGGSSNTNALVAGRSAMKQLASGEKPANEQTLQTILDLFLQAIQQNPNSSEAHFGAAVCLAGQIAQEVDGSSSAGSAGLASPPAPPAAPGKPGSPGRPNGGGGNAPSPPSPPNGRLSAAVAAGDPVEIPPTPPGKPEPQPLPPHRTLGLFWNLDNSLANPYVLLHMLAPISDLRLGLLPYFGYPQDDAARRQKMLDGLNTVADHLAKVEADPNFSVTLPDVDANGATVTVGLPEVLLFDAYVQSMRAEIALSLAYVRDPGPSWNPPTIEPQPMSPSLSITDSVSGGPGFPIPTGFAYLDKNGDGMLTPAEYLPPSPYLTLRDARLLQTAQQAMLAVAEREQKGIEGILARPATGSFLVPNVPDVQKALGEIRDSVIPLIKQAATGPFTIDVPRWDMVQAPPDGTIVPLGASARRGRRVFELGPISGGGGGSADGTLFQPRMEKVTINIAAWFANPPPDLKTFAPTLTLSAGGWPDPSKAVYPDKTFSGLFPGGIAADLPF